MAEDILDLERPQNLRRGRSWSSSRRIGWLVLAVALLAGILGFLGPGLLSKATAGDGNLVVEYDRLLRYHAPTRLRIVLPIAESGLCFLWIDPVYLHDLAIDQMVPPPVRTEVREQWIVYLFRTDPGGRASVTVHARPRTFGPIRGHLGSGTSTVTFQQFALP